MTFLRLACLALALTGWQSSRVALGQGAPKSPGSTLTVSGNGQSKAAPDIAYVTVGVTTEGKKAQEAAASNAHLTQQVMDALKKLNIAERDLQTSNFNVMPRYRQSPQGEGKIDGYQVSNQIRATVRKLGDIGKVLDAALDAGANNVQGVAFGLDAREKAESEALANAVSDARRKAVTISGAAGVKLAGIASIHEGGFIRPMELDSVVANGNMALRTATPIATGELTVNANVTVVYNITPTNVASRVAPSPGGEPPLSESERFALVARLDELSKELAELRVRYTAAHPAIRTVERQIDQIVKRLRSASTKTSRFQLIDSAKFQNPKSKIKRGADRCRR